MFTNPRLILRAREALSQLSYSPISKNYYSNKGSYSQFAPIASHELEMKQDEFREQSERLITKAYCVLKPGRYYLEATASTALYEPTAEIVLE